MTTTKTPKSKNDAPHSDIAQLAESILALVSIASETVAEVKENHKRMQNRLNKLTKENAQLKTRVEVLEFLNTNDQIVEIPLESAINESSPNQNTPKKSKPKGRIKNQIGNVIFLADLKESKPKGRIKNQIGNVIFLADLKEKKAPKKPNTN